MAKEFFMKRKWEKPELIILARSNTEENVLTTCKDEVGGHEGPSYNDRICNDYPGSGCPNCSMWNPS